MLAYASIRLSICWVCQHMLAYASKTGQGKTRKSNTEFSEAYNALGDHEPCVSLFCLAITSGDEFGMRCMHLARTHYKR